MNQAFPSEDGNFKRGAVKPIAIIVGLLLVIGAAAAVVLSIHGEAQSMSKDEATKEMRDIQLLPKADQIPRWKKWADTESEPRLQQEAFVRLSWFKEASVIPSMTKALDSVDHAV